MALSATKCHFDEFRLEAPIRASIQNKTPETFSYDALVLALVGPCPLGIARLSTW